MYIRKCRICGKEFVTDSKDRKLCSRECGDTARRIANKKRWASTIKHCRFCGNDFVQINNEQFCSEKCAKQFEVTQAEEKKRRKMTEQPATVTLEFVHVSSISGNWRWVKHE